MLSRLRIPRQASLFAAPPRVARPPTPLPPPPPHRTRLASTLSSPSKSRPPNARRWQTLGLLGVAGAGLYTYDREFNASAFLRSFRTFIFGLTLALDFKLNFDAHDPEGIDRIHERTARRLSELVDANQGMYIKLAQSLAIQAAILPKPYREAFANVFDAAPAVSYDEVVRVFKREFGVSPEEAFEVFEEKPVASASIAQVHRARLRAEEGRPWRNEAEGWVAVKVRKEAVPKQMEWDLFCYRALLYSYEKLFDLPVAFISQYVSEQMRKEAHLENEARNAEQTARYLADEPGLRERVTVPKVHWRWTGESIMTADFISACRLTDKKRLEEYRLSLKETMDTATELFSAMVFKWGWVQADPHPGNLLVRPNPSRPSHPQVVLIDHGLYVRLPEDFRHDYCLLWQSLFTGDIRTIEDIAVKWGIRRQNSDIFASLTLLRPHRVRKKKSEEEMTIEEREKREREKYEQRAGLKERLKTMLESEELIPRQLIFVTRAMRMMQGNNQAVGSVTNRLAISAHWAATGLALSQPSSSSSLRTTGLRSFAAEKLRLVVFRVVLVFIDIGFLLTRVRAWWMETMGKKGEGLEDLLQKQVTDMAREEFGVEIGEEAFQG
ncbi:hypothetical protein JCM10296v2_003940 [Rhodotorula toruloides]